MRISDWSSDVVLFRSTGALFPSLHTITEGTGLSKNCVVQALARLKAARILDWFRRYETVPDAEAAGAGPRVKQATNADRFLFPAFLAKILPARRPRGRAAASTPHCEQYRQKKVKGRAAAGERV